MATSSTSCRRSSNGRGKRSRPPARSAPVRDHRIPPVARSRRCPRHLRRRRRTRPRPQSPAPRPDRNPHAGRRIVPNRPTRRGQLHARTAQHATAHPSQPALTISGRAGHRFAPNILRVNVRQQFDFLLAESCDSRRNGQRPAVAGASQARSAPFTWVGRVLFSSSATVGNRAGRADDHLAGPKSAALSTSAVSVRQV